MQEPPFFDDLGAADLSGDVADARVLVKVGDSITTDHISPAGAIKADSPAGRLSAGAWGPPGRLQLLRVTPRQPSGDDARARSRTSGCATSSRPGTEGSFTTHLPTGEVTSVFEAAERYRVRRYAAGGLAGKEYGSGSSRDWAAKGPNLLGVRFVIAESFERIHRSNLVGMGVLPLQYKPGDSATSLRLTGHEILSVKGLGRRDHPGQDAMVTVRREDGTTSSFAVTVRVDAPAEVEYYGEGGLLRMVLRQMLAR